MAEKKRKNWIVFGSIAFIAYIFAASTPIGSEPVLKPVWLRRPNIEESGEKSGKELVPYHSNDSFGYFNADGEFALIRRRGERTVLSDLQWADFGKTPESIEIYNSDGSLRFSVAENGYPYFADGKVFIVGAEQNSIVALDDSGKALWRRDFAAPITCADAAAGLALFGLLDGTIELIDQKGARAFAFEPGGSRLPIIVAARLSHDGKKIALVTGIDPQRFVLLARSGQTYKVAHHEYLDRGFRRPVLLTFIDGDSYVAFERENGLAVHDVSVRKTTVLDIQGRVLAFEDERSDKRFFLLADAGAYRELVGVKVPAEVFMRAPFKNPESFIARRGNRLYVGGNGSVAALDIKTK